MRIGIDAKWFFEGHPSGRVFTRNIVEQLVAHYPAHQFMLFLRSADRKLAFPYRAENIQLSYGSAGTNLASNVFILPRLARKARPDVIVSQNFAAPVPGMKQVCVIFDVIFETHPQFFTLRERSYFRFIKPLLRFADSIVTISGESRDDLEEFRYATATRPAEVVHLGVSQQFLDARNIAPDKVRNFKQRMSLPEDFLLYVGRFNARKNIRGLLRSYARIDRSRWKLVLCGRRDWKGERVRDLIAGLGIGEDTIVLEHIQDQDLPLLYRSASAFAYVSFKEGFGLPPLEAMAGGTPVIVSDSKCLREVCGDAPEYVNPESIDDMQRGLERVLFDETRRRRMRELGFLQASHFTWRDSAEKFMHILEKAVGQV